MGDFLFKLGCRLTFLVWFGIPFLFLLAVIVGAFIGSFGEAILYVIGFVALCAFALFLAVVVWSYYKSFTDPTFNSRESNDLSTEIGLVAEIKLYEQERLNQGTRLSHWAAEVQRIEREHKAGTIGSREYTESIGQARNQLQYARDRRAESEASIERYKQRLSKVRAARPKPTAKSEHKRGTSNVSPVVAPRPSEPSPPAPTEAPMSPSPPASVDPAPASVERPEFVADQPAWGPTFSAGYEFDWQDWSGGTSQAEQPPSPSMEGYPTAPPGFYEDPEDPARLRYWAGTVWTDTRMRKPDARDA